MRVKLYSIFILLFFTVWVQGQTRLEKRLDSILLKIPQTEGPICVAVKINDSRAYYKSNIPATGDKPVKIYSATQWLSSAVLLSLADDGKLSLHDRVSKYLPEFKGEKGWVTIRQCLSHTSGYPTTVPEMTNENQTLAQFVNFVAAEVNLNTRPGTEFIYGGVSYMIAGRIAEVVTGKNWDEIFKERIAVPCGMTETHYGDKMLKSTADGAVSTAMDYEKFLQMILNKGVINAKRVLSETSIAELTNDMSGKVLVGFTPYRYKKTENPNFFSAGAWIDRIYASDFKGAELSAQGIKGFTPVIHLCRDYSLVISASGKLNILQKYIEGIKAILDQETIGNCREIPTHSITNKAAYLPVPSVATGLPQNKISVSLIKDSYVQLSIFDPLGNELSNIFDGKLKAGEYQYGLDQYQLKPGVYFYKLIIDNKSETRKFVWK